MCRLDLIFTRDELKALDKKSQAALKKEGIRLVQTSPAIRKIIKNDPKVSKKLETMLRPKFNKLKRK
jgi:hypothetical protein